MAPNERRPDADRVEPLFSGLPERAPSQGLPLAVRIALGALLLGTLAWLTWHQAT